MSPALSSPQRFVKRAFDLVFSLLLLVLFGWLILLAWIAASIDTRSNGMFRQGRIGRGGKTFTVYKIKTMRPRPGLTTTVTAATDARITFLGHWLRRMKIDELPQLFNVLIGDMSFVGPRPDVAGFADQLEGEDRCILSLRPGITGPATLAFRHEEDLLAAVQDPDAYNRETIYPAKVAINLDYLRHYAFTTDLRLILATAHLCSPGPTGGQGGSLGRPQGRQGFEFTVLEPGSIPWERLDVFADRTIFQTRPWLEFLTETQGVKPVVIEINRNGNLLGYFTGGILRKFGIRILGSSFPGWTTSHMGFNLTPEAPLDLVAQELIAFAFADLKCQHIEINDQHLLFSHIQPRFPAARFKAAPGWIVDITGPEAAVLKRMDLNRRRSIKKATERGLIVEAATDDAFVDDYYTQLVDVFKRQGLAPTYSKERVRSLIRNLLPTGNLLLVRVRDPETNQCIGSGIFPAFNGTAYFWGGAAFRSQLHHHPNESMHWFAIRYWRERGMTRYDMMGGGEYKSRYGASYTETHWIRVSRLGVLMALRDLAKKLVRILQIARAQFIKSPAQG